MAAHERGWVRQVGREGLYLATGAFILSIVRVVLGRRLREAGGARRQRLRGLHFGIMAAIGLLATGHVALNSATLRVLVG